MSHRAGVPRPGRSRWSAPLVIGALVLSLGATAAGALALRGEAAARSPRLSRPAAPERSAEAGPTGPAEPTRPRPAEPTAPSPGPGVEQEPDGRAARGPSPGDGDAGPVTYRPPVRAPVTDPFRRPQHPYGPGNRGIEYATVPGTPVRSAARGRVTFAGPVAGSRHVTVTHPDGIRTSYSYLAEITVRVGAPVSAATIVGLAGERFHLGARRGEGYLDPASLWDGPPTASVLVPLDGGGDIG